MPNLIRKEISGRRWSGLNKEKGEAFIRMGRSCN